MFGGFSDLNAIFASFSSFLFGWALCCLNTLSNHAILAFKWCGNDHVYQCTAADKHFSRIMTFLFCGATMGSLFGGFLLRFGRRATLAANYVTYVLGGVICALSVGDYWAGIFYTGRFVVGLAVGLTTVAVPTYISEMTPAAVRGSRGVIHQLMITVGILAGTAIGFAVSVIPLTPPINYVISRHDVRIVQLSLALPAIIGVFGLAIQSIYFVYDTPTYYVANSSTALAATVLQKIHGKEDIHSELQAVIFANEENRAVETAGAGVFSVFKSPQAAAYIWVIVFGCVLSAGQQLTGINVFVSLSAKLFENAGMDPAWTTTACTIVAAVNTLMTFPAMTVDKFGRRAILLSMVTGQTMFLLLYPISTCITSSSSTLSIMSLISVVGYTMCFAVGYGPVMWLYFPEIFPPEIRALGSSMTAAVNWFSTVFIVYFGTVVDDTRLKFSVFSGMGIFFTIWIFLFMKETKGITYSPYIPPASNKFADDGLLASQKEEERAHFL